MKNKKRGKRIFEGVSVVGRDPDLDDIPGTAENMLKEFKRLISELPTKEQKDLCQKIEGIHIINS